MSAIVRLRKQAGMSRYALAKATDYNYLSLTEAEAGSTEPRLSSLIRVARVLGPRLGRAPADVLVELSGINDMPAEPQKARSA